MKYKLFLRFAAATMLFHTLGHTIGALTWRKAPNGAIANVINATITSFYEGYRIMMIFVLLLVTFSLWLMSDETHALTQKPLPLMIIYLILETVIE